MGNDKLSSPSSSSHNLLQFRDGVSVGNSSSAGKMNSHSDEPCLVIKNQPPSSVYSNESFKVEVHLELPKATSPPTTIWNIDDEVHLKATLYNAKTGNAVRDEATLMTKPMQITIPGVPSGENDNENQNNGKRAITVECMIRSDIIRRDGESSYVVRFSTIGEEKKNNIFTSPVRTQVVRGVATSPTQLVNYKILAKTGDDWESIWYKDEGGRDKCMEVGVAIYDKDGQLKTGENIPLKPVLCYEITGGGESKVINQDILRTLGTTNTMLDKDTGRTKLRFRVEDVSKNHQGQNFVLKIAPDTTAKRHKDIAAAFTPAVNVRSKRNKRSRGGGNRQSSGKMGDISGRNSDSPNATRQRLSGSFGGGGLDGLRSGLGGPNMSFNPNNADALHQAMRGIIGWADVVVNELYPLQWQVLGYQQMADGSGPDYSRPYHNMPNPNAPISRILSAYTDHVRGHLRVLLSAVDEAQAKSMGAGGGVSNAAADFMSTSVPGRDFNAADPYGSLLGTNRFGMPGEAGVSGLHPNVGPEGYRVRGDTGSGLSYSGRPSMPGMPLAQNFGLQGPNAMSAAGMPQHQGLRGSHLDAQQRSLGAQPCEADVEYILAKQYKTLRNGTRLGFPAFSADKEILGFFREGGGKPGVGKFVPIGAHADDFGPLEIMQASEILDDFIAKESKAIHCLKDHANLSSMLDACLLYDWSKDASNGSNVPGMQS